MLNITKVEQDTKTIILGEIQEQLSIFYEGKKVCEDMIEKFEEVLRTEFPEKAEEIISDAKNYGKDRETKQCQLQQAEQTGNELWKTVKEKSRF